VKEKLQETRKTRTVKYKEESEVIEDIRKYYILLRPFTEIVLVSTTP
jgi:hypothetical protein